MLPAHPLKLATTNTSILPYLYTGSNASKPPRFALCSPIHITFSRLVPLRRLLAIMIRTHEGYWDPQTSTVDWCESNYTVTKYCAEAINATTNILFLYLGLKGIAKYRHDTILLISYIGYLTVGIGSFLFHATLKCKLALTPTT